MEALDGNSRQSGISPIIHRQKVDRINTDQSYSSSNTMAAAAVVGPAIYSNPAPPPYTSNWSAPGPSSISGLISPPDSRRTSDNKTEAPQLPISQPHRQSLPSIHEALSSEPTAYKSPVSASFPPHPPFSQGTTPRSYHPSEQPSYVSPSHAPRQATSPKPIHPQHGPFSRVETAYTESSRHAPFTGVQLAAGPPNPFAVPRGEVSRYEPETRIPERPAHGYTHQPPPPPQHGSYTYGPPPHQSLPGAPSGPPYSQPQYHSRDGSDSNGYYKGPQKTENLFKQSLKRCLNEYSFENNLAQVNTSSRMILEWSTYFFSIAHEQPSYAHGMPDRMPDSDGCMEMVNHAKNMVGTLEKMHEMVQEHERSAVVDQRMREMGGRSGAYDDEMDGDYMKHSAYGENKKRRGRAAPPGRCHSCNRAETPEWRRGPDGARTLCNACGLHYAKLTRKQNKQSLGSNGSALRPKSRDGNDTRPPLQ